MNHFDREMVELQMLIATMGRQLVTRQKVFVHKNKASLQLLSCI